MSSADLADALDFARTNGVNIHSLTVVRNGAIVLDAYFYPFVPETRHDLASATKSVLSMLVGAAIADGRIDGLQQPLRTVLRPELAKSLSGPATEIRVRDLVTMQSGFDCGYRRGEQELRDMRRAPDWVAYALRLPMVSEPGTRFGYCSPNFHLLSAAITSATNLSALDYARRRLFAPLGITDVYWPADSAGLNRGWGDLQLRPLDMAKLGLLMLHGGRWEDAQVLPAAWVASSAEVAAVVNENEDYGLGWWVSRRIPTLFEANGRGGQRISVVPDKDLVVVMTGGGFEPGDIGRFVSASLRSNTPLPDDSVGQARLATALEQIRMPPARHAETKSPTAARISGRVYTLEDNLLGFRSFALEFPRSGAPALRLGLASGEILAQPLGMDGQYRLTTLYGGAVSAGRADWLGDGRLRVELNRLSLINRFVFDVEFRGEDLLIDASEPTELGQQKLVGTWRR